MAIEAQQQVDCDASGTKKALPIDHMAGEGHMAEGEELFFTQLQGVMSRYAIDVLNDDRPRK